MLAYNMDGSEKPEPLTGFFMMFVLWTFGAMKVFYFFFMEICWIKQLPVRYEANKNAWTTT